MAYRRRYPTRRRVSYRHRTSYRTRGALSSARYGRRTSYRTRLNNDAIKCLKVIQYPHSTITTNPKIPDGSKAATIGLRKHFFNSHTFADDGMLIVLQPNMISPVAVADYDAVGEDYSWKSSEGYRALLLGSDSLTEGATSLTITGDNVRQWRLVSAGIRIRCTNNDTQDSGSWKAARIPVTTAPTKYAVQTTGAPKQLVNLIPRVDTLPNTVEDMSNQYSFTSGLLKDIGKKYFRLLDTAAGAHEWNECTGNVLEYGTAVVNGSTSAIDRTSTIGGLIDEQTDSVWIKITGVASVTSIIIDAVVNYEYIPFNESADARFMDETSFAPTAYERLKNSLRVKHTKA